MAQRLFEDVEIARLYQKFRLDYGDCQLGKKIVTFLREKLPKAVESTAVDVACGTGFLTRIIAPHFHKVVGVDCSKAQIDVARENTTSRNIEYRMGFGENLRFITSKSVDLVSVAMGIFYFRADKFFAEADRILKPGGVVVVFNYGRDGFRLTPDTNNVDVIGGCQEVIDEVYTIGMQSVKVFKRPAEFEEFLSPRSYQSQGFDVSVKKVGDIDSVIGFISSMGSMRKYIKDHPEEEEKTKVYRRRLMSLLADISSSPEEVQFTLESPGQCAMFRKPIN